MNYLIHGINRGLQKAAHVLLIIVLTTILVAMLGIYGAWL